MPVFETLDFLEQYIQNVTIPQIGDIVDTEVKEELNKQVEENLYADIYANPEDDFYEHTFGLRDSAVSEIQNVGNSRVGKGLLFDFYLDPNSKYYSYYPVGQEKDVTDSIVLFLDQGHRGFYKGFTVNSEPKNFFGDTVKELSKKGKLKKSITNNLKRLGYVISRLSSD